MLVSGGFLFVFSCIFLSLVTVYHMVVAFKSSFFSGLVGRVSLSLVTTTTFNNVLRLRAMLFHLLALLFDLCTLYLYWPFGQM
jgi:hypothetical protein